MLIRFREAVVVTHDCKTEERHSDTTILLTEHEVFKFPCLAQATISCRKTSYLSLEVRALKKIIAFIDTENHLVYSFHDVKFYSTSAEWGQRISPGRITQ